jgi:hypothetical protein
MDLSFKLLMTSPQQSNPYATERYFVGENRFIEIEFYKDGEQHRVWPYIGRSSEEHFKGHLFACTGVKHFVVPGAFETQTQAREAARSNAQQYLAIADWECYV